MGFSPTISFFPTYPTPTLAVVTGIPLGDHSARVGVFSDSDNEFNEQFIVGEAALRYLSTTFKLGLWHQSGDINLVNGEVDVGVMGFYGLAEGDIALKLFNNQSTGWFAQLGVSDEEYAEIALHIGVGLTFYGPFSRAEDVMGLGVTHVKTSELLSDELAGSETAFELFYRYQFNGNISVKPDFQYIINSASALELDNTFILTLRTELSF